MHGWQPALQGNSQVYQRSIRKAHTGPAADAACRRPTGGSLSTKCPCAMRIGRRLLTASGPHRCSAGCAAAWRTTPLALAKHRTGRGLWRHACPSAASLGAVPRRARRAGKRRGRTPSRQATGASGLTRACSARPSGRLRRSRCCAVQWFLCQDKRNSRIERKRRVRFRKKKPQSSALPKSSPLGPRVRGDDGFQLPPAGQNIGRVAEKVREFLSAASTPTFELLRTRAQRRNPDELSAS